MPILHDIRLKLFERVCEQIEDDFPEFSKFLDGHPGGGVGDVAQDDHSSPLLRVLRPYANNQSKIHTQNSKLNTLNSSRGGVADL